MSVALAITHIQNLFGANRSLLFSLDAFKQKGYEPIVVVPQVGDLCDELERREIPYIISPVPWWVTPKTSKPTESFATDLGLAASTLLKKIKNHSVSLVYTNSSVTPLGATVARQLGCYHVWHLREFSDLDYDLELKVAPETRQKAYSRDDQQMVANSQAVLRHHGIEDLLSAKVIYNCVEDKPLLPKPTVDGLRIAIIGHLHKQKGQLWALRALEMWLQERPKAQLDIVGDGYEIFVTECEDFVAKAKLTDQVNFHGEISDVYSFLTDIDLVLVPSFHEAFGRVTAEAMMWGRPVLARNSGGTPELIAHEQTGLLFSSAAELITHLTTLECSLELRSTLAQNARAFAEKHFSTEQYTGSISTLIQPKP